MAVEATYILSALHAQGLNLLDGLDIVTIIMIGAICGGSDLVDLLADCFEMV